MKKNALVIGAVIFLSQSVFAGSKITCSQAQTDSDIKICESGKAEIRGEDLIGACQQAGGKAVAALARYLYRTTSDSNVRIEAKLTGLYDELRKQTKFEIQGLIEGKITQDVIVIAEKAGNTCKVTSLELFK